MFESLSRCHNVLILGKSHLKGKQRPNMVIAVDLHVKHQFKQTLTPRISYIESLSRCHNVLILGKSHLKGKQRPNMVIAVDLIVKHQFKQTLTPRISYIGTHTVCRKRSFSLAKVNIHTMLLYSTLDINHFNICPLH